MRVSWIALALVALTFAIYAQVAGHELLYWDDDLYIFATPELADGLSLEGARRAFTEPYQMAWMPLTKLSLLANHTLHGTEPAGYLLGNVVLHAVGSVLLLLALRRLTGEVLPSAFVAAVFACHPLHVESVAWASERKDVLSAVFWMATLLAYARYAEPPLSATRYALMLLLFSLGLMSKATLVTLPCVLLLIDFWPLERWRATKASRLLLEKAPLFLLAAATSVITLAIQRESGAVVGEGLALGARLTNAVHSYLAYLGDAFWPSRLAVFHSYGRASFSLPGALAGGALLAVLTGLALRLAPSHGYLATGWLWFVGTLVPMIGIVQVGMQARADRYMYIPLVGLSIAVAWGARHVWSRLGWPPRALAALAVVCTLALGGAAWVQVGHWRNTETLFQHAVTVSGGNYVAHSKLGDEYVRLGALDRAELHYRASLQIKGDWLRGHAGLGSVLARLGRPAEAVVNLEIAARLEPDSLERKLYLAQALARAGRLEDARRVAEPALRLARERGDAAMARSLAALLADLAGAGRPAPARPR
jgi:tetratricopeptide (TPR) repeat protein